MTYQETARWARWWANRYKWALDSRADVDLDDLIQAASLGICQALECYDESGNWAKWSSYFIRKEIRSLLGIRNRTIPRPPLSLDAPADDDSDESMIDLLADENAPDAQEITEYNDLQRQVRAAVARLTDDRQREVVERTRLNGESQSAVARDFGVSASRIHSIWNAARHNLAQDTVLRKLAEIELKTTYIGHTGPRSFQTHHTSDVERAVIWREQQRARLAKLLHDCDERDAALAALK